MVKSKNVIIDNNSYIVTRDGKLVRVYQQSEGRSAMNCVFEHTFRFVSEAKAFMAIPAW